MVVKVDDGAFNRAIEPEETGCVYASHDEVSDHDSRLLNVLLLEELESVQESALQRLLPQLR